MSKPPSVNNKLKKVIAGVTSLPTLPQVVSKVNSMLSDPDVTAAKVGDVIATDPSLTARILKMVNSAYYGFPHEIVQISHAISILGFITTRSLLLTTSVIKTFGSLESKGCNLDYTEFWVHSLAVATASRNLAKHLGAIAQAEDLYIAGLLHDIGKLVLSQYFSADYQKVLQQSHDRSVRLMDAETESFEFTHEDVGGLLAVKWDLPIKLISSISNHHHPLAGDENKPYFFNNSIVHVADMLCKMMDIGDSGDEFVPQLDKKA